MLPVSASRQLWPGHTRCTSLRDLSESVENSLDPSRRSSGMPPISAKVRETRHKTRSTDRLATGQLPTPGARFTGWSDRSGYRRRGTDRGTRDREIPVESVHPALSASPFVQVAAMRRTRVPLGDVGVGGHLQPVPAVAGVKGTACLQVLASWQVRLRLSASRFRSALPRRTTPTMAQQSDTEMLHRVRQELASSDLGLGPR